MLLSWSVIDTVWFFILCLFCLMILRTRDGLHLSGSFPSLHFAVISLYLVDTSSIVIVRDSIPSINLPNSSILSFTCCLLPLLLCCSSFFSGGDGPSNTKIGLMLFFSRHIVKLINKSRNLCILYSFEFMSGTHTHLN